VLAFAGQGELRFRQFDDGLPFLSELLLFRNFDDVDGLFVNSILPMIFTSLAGKNPSCVLVVEPIHVLLEERTKSRPW
jgi:hypothetical protein